MKRVIVGIVAGLLIGAAVPAGAGGSRDSLRARVHDLEEKTADIDHGGTYRGNVFAHQVVGVYCNEREAIWVTDTTDRHQRARLTCDFGQ